MRDEFRVPEGNSIDESAAPVVAAEYDLADPKTGCESVNVCRERLHGVWFRFIWGILEMVRLEHRTDGLVMMCVLGTVCPNPSMSGTMTRRPRLRSVGIW